MFSYEDKLKLLKNKDCVTRPQSYITAAYYDRVKHLDDCTRMQYLDINLWMVGDILLKADRMSMANSLELRVPFLDKEVFKVAASLPTHLRVQKGQKKVALRKAAQRRLPIETAEKKKLGFPVPTRVWLKDKKYYNIVKEAFTSPIAQKFFHTDELIDCLDTHYNGLRDYSRRIWTLFIFIVWYEIYFEDGGHEPGNMPNFSK